MCLYHMRESDSACGDHSNVIRGGPYGCVACAVAINIETNVVQGDNFNTGNSKISFLLYDNRWKIAWRTKVW